MQNTQKLIASGTLFFQCDMQTLFNNPKILYGIQGVLESSMYLNEIAGIFKIPLIVSEHNPKIFGPTIPELKQLWPHNHHMFEKTSFSMYNDDLKKILEQYKDRKSVIIYGIESHICIQQTCLDLLRNGYTVHLITDATSSSKPIFRSTALQRLQQAGVILNTSQAVMFELLGDYKVPEFKEAIKLVKKYPFENILSHL